MSEYDESQARSAAVHAREDLVLVVSYLASLNRQLMWARWLLVMIATLLGWIAFRLRVWTLS